MDTDFETLEQDVRTTVERLVEQALADLLPAREPK